MPQTVVLDPPSTGALTKLRARPEWQFFAALRHAHLGLATAWWTLLVLRGLLPASFAVAMGWLVGAVQSGDELTRPLAAVGVIFVLLQVLTPIHKTVGANLGSRLAAWLYDDLARSSGAPAGLGHLEDPQLESDRTMARDFDLGITGPPLNVAMDFIASGLVEMVAGLASAIVLFAYNWWAPLLLAGAWSATHWLLRESGVWKDRNTEEVRLAQRHADYAYRVAVDPPAAKELRLFGLSPWLIEGFRQQRRRLFELRWRATRMRQRPMIWSLLLVVAANSIVFVSLAEAASDGAMTLDTDRLVTFAMAAIGTSMIAFGGLTWALDGAAAPVASALRLRTSMLPRGTVAEGSRSAEGLPAREIRFRDVSFTYPTGEERVLTGLDLVIPAGSSLAIVGQNGAGKTTLAKLLCRFYDPQSGAIEADGIDLRQLAVDSWRSRIAAVFQDYVRFELTLRENVAPSGASDASILAALRDAGAENLADLDTVLARGYRGGTELSGGQWQRVALARALCAVREGAALVLLDEPTAQLDTRGEAEIFERILAATRGVTTILVSHRFSTVRLAQRICVVEDGRVVEIGSHQELMAQGGRYRTMFDLQAERFAEDGEEEGLDVLD